MMTAWAKLTMAAVDGRFWGFKNDARFSVPKGWSNGYGVEDKKKRRLMISWAATQVAKVDRWKLKVRYSAYLS